MEEIEPSYGIKKQDGKEWVVDKNDEVNSALSPEQLDKMWGGIKNGLGTTPLGEVIPLPTLEEHMNNIGIIASAENREARINHLERENKALRKRVKEQSKNLKGLGNTNRWLRQAWDMTSESSSGWRDSYYDLKESYAGSLNKRFWTIFWLVINAIFLFSLTTIIIMRIPK